MYNKWFIMVAGIITVFVALALIIGMLYLFRIIFGERKDKKRKGPAPLPEIHGPVETIKPSVVSAQVSEGAGTLSKTALVAIITATISAATGVSPSSFRIIGINQVSDLENGFNTPVWGRIERFAR